MLCLSVIVMLMSICRIAVAAFQDNRTNFETSIFNKTHGITFARHKSVRTFDRHCALMERKKARPMRILISSTDKYLSIFLNWLIFFNNVCDNIASIYFVCLDQEIENRLPNYGLNCSHVHHLPEKYSNNRLWLLRVRIVKGLLEKGFDVMMSDSDALWLQNPFEIISKFRDSDVIASRAAFPEEISAKLGATVCMGFLYVKASNRTVVMWEELFKYMVKVPHADDQRNFNQLLLTSGIKFDPKPTYLNNKIANTGSFRLEGHSLKLTLLPHSQFIRMCDPRRKGNTLRAVVAHCISLSKTEDTKSFSERMYGVWALRDSWEQVRFTTDMETLVMAIRSHNVSDSLLQHSLTAQLEPAVSRQQASVASSVKVSRSKTAFRHPGT